MKKKPSKNLSYNDLPESMANGLSCLEDLGFTSAKPSKKSLELQYLATEFAKTLSIRNIVAITLTGSSVIGTAVKGSDMDMDFIVAGKRNRHNMFKDHFKGVPVDYSIISTTAWESEYLSRDGMKFLTHTVPIYDPDSYFKNYQSKILKAYYSKGAVAQEHKRVKEILRNRSSIALQEIEQDYLPEAAIRIESCFYEVISFLIRKNKACPATSLLFSEFKQLAKTYNRPDWPKRAIKDLRFDLPKNKYFELLEVYEKLFSEMRRKLNANTDLVRKIKRMKLGLFSAANDIVPLCSEINYQQLYDKITRALIKNKKENAGLALLYESQDNFFMFSPFFYLKHVEASVSGKAIANTSFHDLLACWDEDIRSQWMTVSRFDILTKEMLLDLHKLNHEIFTLSY